MTTTVTPTARFPAASAAASQVAPHSSGALPPITVSAMPSTRGIAAVIKSSSAIKNVVRGPIGESPVPAAFPI